MVLARNTDIMTLAPFRIYGKLSIHFVDDASSMKAMLMELQQAFSDSGGWLALNLEGAAWRPDFVCVDVVIMPKNEAMLDST